MAAITEALNVAEQRVQQAGFSDTPRLDVELLLSFTINKDRSYFVAFPERELTVAQEQQFNALLDAAVTGKPIAYITGSKEFWSLDLTVTEDTLIPRPDTETLIEKVLGYYSSEKTKTLIDLGTGSGAIALALKKELPSWQVLACDYSEKALLVAQENAKRLGIDVGFSRSDWLAAFNDVRVDVIVSNPPYIEEGDAHLKKLGFEPVSALVAKDKGLADIKTITAQACRFLNKGGSLWLEHGFNQGAAVREILIDAGFDQVDTFKDLAGNDRVTSGFYHG